MRESELHVSEPSVDAQVFKKLRMHRTDMAGIDPELGASHHQIQRVRCLQDQRPARPKNAKRPTGEIEERVARYVLDNLECCDRAECPVAKPANECERIAEAH